MRTSLPKYFTVPMLVSVRTNPPSWYKQRKCRVEHGPNHREKQ